jgi:hypothetical protein
MMRICDRYLSVVARSLDGTLYGDPPLQVFGNTHFDPAVREIGWDWPSVAFTMIGTKRLANVRLVLESVIGERVPGDFVETGVWRGGACIMARAVLAAYGITDRRVILCDSFAGLPPPDPVRFPADAGSTFHEYTELAVPLAQVQENFRKFDLLDAQVVFVPGWFRDTMAQVPSTEIAVLRLDGDMYESTMDPLTHLYDRIPSGGYVVVDDYHVVPSAKAAVHDFLDARGEKVSLCEIDGVGVFFRKDEPAFLARKAARG